MNALVPTPLHGEVLTPRAVLAVTAILHPLKTERQLVFVPVGSSLAEIVVLCAEQGQVSRLASGARVTINGHVVPRAHWHRVRPHADAHVMVRAVAGRGMGNILRSVLSLALIAVTGFLFGPAGALLSGTMGSLVGAGVMIAGSLLINALFPPSTTKAETQQQLYSIASRRNDAHRWGPIPELFGKHRIAPKFATSPYTEPSGNEQDLYQLFVMGHGPMKVEDIRIGDTPIGDYQGVEVQVREGYASDLPQTIVPSQVIQTDLQIEPDVGTPATQDAADDAVSIALDLFMPQGMFNVNQKKGQLDRHSVNMRIEIINRATSAVVETRNFTIAASSRNPFRRTQRFTVPKGRYAARLTRLTAIDNGRDITDQIVWTAMRSYRDEPVIQYTKPLALIAVKIRASKQLSGAIADLTAVCTKRLRSWNGTQWVNDQPTRSPADAFRHVLMGRAIARPRTNDQIDWPSLEHWADICREKGWTFDMYRDFRSSVPDALRDICAAGRAVPIFRDGKWSVAMEDVAAPLVQMFTPRNVQGFTRAITYAEQPHAFRCKFVNELKDWIEDEILVYADGYSRANATLFEQIEFPGVTHPDAIFKHARYRMAERVMRRSFYSFTTDAEHLVLTRGDRCKVSHYVVQQKAVQGRVIAVDGQTVVLDEPVTMEAGKTYAIETRRVMEHATIVATNAVQTVAGENRVVTISGAVPKAGDLFAFGEPNTISLDARVLRITPGSDLSATIELVDSAPGIQNADDGPITPGPGIVEPAPPISTYRPRNLRVSEATKETPAGTVYVVRLTWDMIPPPGRNVQSYLVVALGADGTELRRSVGPDEMSAEFEDLQSGEWTFRVFAYIEGLGISTASNPLTVAINVPWDELGVGLGNVQPDIRSVFEIGIEGAERFGQRLDELAANAASADIILKKEGDRSRAMILEERTVRADETGALARRTDGVQAELGNLGGAIGGISTAISTLEARVTDTETVGSSLIGVTADLAGFIDANASAIQSLNATVTSQGNTISAQASQLQGVQVKADAATAEGLRMVQARAGPSGVSVRFAERFRVSDGQAYSDAGWYVDVSTAGVSTIVFDFQKFVITDQTGKYQPFTIQNGVLFANAAVLASLIVGQLEAEQIRADSITAREIKSDSITRVYHQETSSIVTLTTSMQNILTMTIPREAGVKVVNQISCEVTNATTGPQQVVIEFVVDGVVVKSFGFSTQLGSNYLARSFFTLQAGTGTQTIIVRAMRTTSNGNVRIDSASLISTSHIR